MRRLALAALSLVLLGAGCGGTHLVVTKQDVVRVLAADEAKSWGPQRHHYDCVQADHEGRHYKCFAYGDPGTGTVVPMFRYDVTCDAQACQWQVDSLRP